MSGGELLEILESAYYDFNYIGSCCADEREALHSGLQKLESVIEELKGNNDS